MLTHAEKAKLRVFLTRSAILHDLDVRFEAAMNALAALNDNGESETLIRTYLTKIDALEDKIDESVLGCVDVFKVKGIEQDPRQSVFMAERRARQLQGRIAVALASLPIWDPWGPPKLGDFGTHHFSGGVA